MRTLIVSAVLASALADARPMLAALLTTVLFSFSAISGRRLAHYLRGTQANLTRLLLAAALVVGAGVIALRNPAAAPQAYTPPHLADKIMISRGAMIGERKQVTVLFADLKGSMELLAERGIVPK